MKKYKEAAEAWEKVIAFCEYIGYDEEVKWPKQELLKLQALIDANT